MKYIRTKDGRIRVVVEPSEFDEEERRKIPDNCTMVKANNIFGCAIVGNEDIVKQADTIKELCDEFVIVNNADKQPFRISVKVINEMTYNNDDRCGYSGSSAYTFDFAKEKLEKVREFCGTKENHDEYANYLYEEDPDFKFTISLYGAIWTSKGLIFVAKLNEKGELELL